MNENIIKEIESGKYKDCYVVYIRKSTDEPNSQQNSLDYQRTETAKTIKAKKLKVAQISVERFVTNGIITEKHSSFKEDEQMVFNSDGTVQFNIERPKFYKLVEYLNKKLFKGVVFLSWDRASRNPTDSTIIKKLIKNGVDIHFSLANYDKTSSGALSMDVDGMFAEHHSRVTSEKVTLALNKNREKRKCYYQAPVGYLNEGNVDYKPFDPIRAPLVKRMFELAGDGWSLADIAKCATEHGFTMPPKRKRRSRAEIEADEEEDDALEKREKVNHEVRYTTIQPILRNRFYIGEVIVEGKNKNDRMWAQSDSHEALVSVELFNKVQFQLAKKYKTKHYNEPLDYPFRGIFSCPTCVNRTYLPYPKKGIMYCQVKHDKSCGNTISNFNLKNVLEEQVRPLIEKLVFTEAELNTFETRLGSDIGKLRKSENKKQQDKDRKKHKLREDLAFLQENKISLLRTKTYTPEGIVAEEQKLQTQIDQLMTEEQISEEAIKAVVKDVYTITELLKDIVATWDFADLYEKQEIIKCIFTELSISEKPIQYKVKNGFKPFEDRFVFTCARERT